MIRLSRKTQIGFAVLLIGFLALLIAAAWPWESLLESQIKTTLKSKGFEKVHLTLSVEPQGHLSLKDIKLGAPAPLSAEELTLTYAPLDLFSGKMGTWQIKNLILQNNDFPLPPLDGKGTLLVQTDHLALQGQFESAAHTHALHFKMDYSFRDPAKQKLSLLSAQMPWHEGTISLRDVHLQLSGKQTIHANLKLERVSVAALLQLLTGNKATATGVLSGTLPVTINADGMLSIHDGSLKAQEPGTIALSPDMIPGNNAQVDFVREVLKDLHYTLFSIHLNSNKNNKLSVLMSLHGNNPAIQSGRPVELNVNLTGDMLNFVQQNLIWLSDPQKLLERGQNEAP